MCMCGEKADAWIGWFAHVPGAFEGIDSMTNVRRYLCTARAQRAAIACEDLACIESSSLDQGPARVLLLHDSTTRPGARTNLWRLSPNTQHPRRGRRHFLSGAAPGTGADERKAHQTLEIG